MHNNSSQAHPFRIASPVLWTLAPQDAPKDTRRQDGIHQVQAVPHAVAVMLIRGRHVDARWRVCVQNVRYRVRCTARGAEAASRSKTRAMEAHASPVPEQPTQEGMTA
jgi:hypothetical protein